MDDKEYDELLSNGQQSITLSIPINDHVWRAFKRACEYSQNDGRPYPEGNYLPPQKNIKKTLDRFLGEKNLILYPAAKSLQ